MKTCRICKTEKLNNCFGKDSDNRDGLNTICRPCNKIYMAKYKEANKKSQRAYQLKKYGLDQQGFETLLALQHGVCKICGGPPTVYDKYVVDHDHDTGAVRGLLCQHCNTGIGRFKDSSAIMESAKRYIVDSKVNKFRELEIKMKVPVVGVATSFIEWISSYDRVHGYTKVTGQDVYWEKDGTVIRHRLCGSQGGEITLKNRTSSSSTVDRVEVDLFLNNKTSPEDVSAFLGLAGFKVSAALTKTSHIFEMAYDKCMITVVYYEVTNDLAAMPVVGYVEVEIDKEADIKISTATKILKDWQDLLVSKGLEPVSDSLYEIYSGKTYQSV